ncbi:MAG: ABC transporter permease [Ilumatobacteraceae bacterium]|jgi:branched-chain amino acid transport system permease protein|nr:ABC transporter [Acidimicrobiia bacterium]
MTDYLFYLLLGSAAGAIIAALGVGMVITYQASGVVNFAAGAMAMWSTYVYADLRNGSYPFPIPGLPDRYHFGDDVGYRWALLLALLTSAVLGLLVYVLIFKPLRQAPALAKVVASVGLIIVFITLVARRFEDMSAIRVPKILPREPVTITRDLTVPRDGLWLLFIVLAIAAALWVGSRFLRIGLAIRASAENEKGAVLLGYSPDFLAGLGWVLSSVITTFLAILAAPQLQLNPTIYTFGFLVPALGAALIGKFQNFGPTVVTGVLIGMGQSLCTKLQNDLSWFPEYGAREGIPFVIIILTMVFLGERLPDRGAVKMWKLPTVPPARVTPVSFLVPTLLAIAGIVVLGPLWRAAIMTTVIAAVLALSLVVLTGFGGQTSLSQMAFAGIAGFALSKLAMRYDIPFPIAPLLAATAAMVFGLIVGIPALRVRGTNLAIVTLAGGVTIAEFVFKNPWVIGDISTGGAKVPNPSLGSWDLGLVYGTNVSRPVFGVFLVVILALLGLLVANIRRSGSGRVMLAVRGNERAAAAVGIDVTRVKMTMFAASSFIAGVGGTLIAYRFGSVSDLSYGVVASLTALSVAYLGGITSVSGAVTAGITAQAGIAFYGMSRLFDGLGSWEALIGGVLLIITAILNPEGIAGGIRLQVAEARAKKQRAAAASVH